MTPQARPRRLAFLPAGSLRAFRCNQRAEFIIKKQQCLRKELPKIKNLTFRKLFCMNPGSASYILYKGGVAVKEIEVVIDTEEIAEFFFHELAKRGYVPTEGELDELADITFEYLLQKCIIDEEIEDD